MNLAVVRAAQWDRELVTDFAPECAQLSKANVVAIRGAAAADQARLPRDEFEVVLVADPARLRKG